MATFLHLRQMCGVSLALILAATAAPVCAGPWSQLPDAVALLQRKPGDASAQAVLDRAEASIIAEAQSGRLPAVRALMEAYASLVMRLPDGDVRLARLERQTAQELVAYGASRRRGEVAAAVSAWALAADFDSSSVAVNRLREILLPPAEAEEGAVWIAPLDRSELVFLPAARVRVGCSEVDRKCRENEVYFRWVEVPAFWIAKTETTNDCYRRCVEAGVCTPPNPVGSFADPARGDEPVVNVTWLQARRYTRWAGRRLPSESEWERAARGKEMRWRYPWSSNGRREDLANVWPEPAGPSGSVVPVGTFPSSDWGLFDMAGNVWEWCADSYQSGFKELPPDGSPMPSGLGRVVRGGSWRRSIDLARVSARSWFEEEYAADDVGFRSAADPSAEVSSAAVIAMAAAAFPDRSPVGHELDGANLTTEDRRYLDRRAVTWLVLEGRTTEAMQTASALLAGDPGDRVALGVVDDVEDEVAAAVAEGDFATAAQLVAAYAVSVDGNRQLDRRYQATVDGLLGTVRDNCTAAVRSRDRTSAEACVDLGLHLAPDDRELQALAARVARQAGDTRRSGVDGREMVWVSTGTFRLGASDGDHQAALDELPAINVRVAGYWIDRTEVTNAEYRQCVEAGACTPPERTEAFDDPNRASEPVLFVSWDQAWLFAQWAGKRLPSEAEWERAARAGSVARYPWGSEWDPAMANGLGVWERDRFAEAAPVASFPGNAWGIYDMVGNAAEWVQDVYHAGFTGAPRDGTPWEQEDGPISERERVVRGGSFLDQPARNRVSRRAGRKPAQPHRAIGFRCASSR